MMWILLGNICLRIFFKVYNSAAAAAVSASVAAVVIMIEGFFPKNLKGTELHWINHKLSRKITFNHHHHALNVPSILTCTQAYFLKLWFILIILTHETHFGLDINVIQTGFFDFLLLFSL